MIGGMALVALLQSCGEAISPPPHPAPGLSVDDEVARAITSAYDAASSHLANAGARAELAMVYDAAQMNSLAEITYQQALELDEDHAEWWYHLARMRERLGDYPGAMTAIDRAAALAPNEFIIDVRKGMWLLDQGEPAEADAVFRAALKKFPDSLSARLGLARAMISKNEFAPAIPILEQLRSVHPTDSVVRRMLGLCYMNSGRQREGQAELALGVTAKWDWNVEDQWLDDVRAKRTGYRAQYERALSFLEAGSAARAVTLLEAMRAEHPGDVPVAIALSSALEAAGQIDQALNVMLQFDARMEEHFAIKLNLGHFYQAKGDLSRAMHFTNEAIALNPTLSAGHAQKAQLLLSQNQIDAADQEVDEAIRCDANNPDARFLKAQVLMNRKQFPAAVEVLEEATRSHPHLAQGFALLAAARYNAGNAAGGLLSLEQAERLDANNPIVRAIRQQMRGGAQSSAGNR